MAERHSEDLELVYRARNSDELTAAYGKWASEYDRETLSSSYCLPFFALSWVARHVPRGAGPLLDAGCGTGLSGPCLKALGYAPLEGLDFSEEMLKLAASRDAYDVLKRATLGEVLPWSDGHFAACLSTGVFTEGHAPASGLNELCRITRKGGHAIFIVRDIVFESGGFAAVMSLLQENGLWRQVEESVPFRAFVIDEPDVLVKAYVFEVL